MQAKDLYSQGVAQFADLFAPPADEAANFVTQLARPESRVLDIGAGTGHLAFSLAAAGHPVTALEPDPEMFTVLLSRLTLRPELHERVTPIPQPAGFAFESGFDLATSFAVLHLLPPAERLALMRYAREQVRPDGLVVLEIPVLGASRQPAPQQLVGKRRLGEAFFEKHSAMGPVEDGWWHTHWRFRVLLKGQPVHEVERTFRWYPLPPNEAATLLDAAGLEVRQQFAGFDRSPFVSGTSKVMLVVARPHGAGQ